MQCLTTVAKKQGAYSGTSAENNQYSLKYYHAKFYACITNCAILAMQCEQHDPMANDISKL